jgi:tetratricopeptide (TPR) repeat protein
VQRPLAQSLILGLLVLLAFGGALSLGFVGFDDPVYVTENPMVLGGLSSEGFSWALNTHHGNTWLPLTWLSHQLDATLFGASPAGHHGTSVALHLANALLAIYVLRRATGKYLAAFGAAALWALHPLRVESVAWVSSRKDLLSGLCFLGLLLAWIRYTERPSALRYSLAVLLMALGLAAKQVLVTAPFVLLLLDAWPLKRKLEPRLLLEKLPLLALAALASWKATLSQAGSVEASTEVLSLGQRMAGALLAYGSYIRQSFLPGGFAAHYPDAGTDLSMGAAAAVAAMLLVSILLALRLRQRAPALAVGWFWFLGMLVPMLGLVSFGITTSHADRFTYLPSLGLAIAVVYGISALLGPAGQPAAARSAGAFALVCVILSHQQTKTWNDDRSLWNHALIAAGPSSTVYFNLAEERRRAGDAEAALGHLKQALLLSPDDAHIMKRLGAMLAQAGRPREAMPLLKRASEVLPEDFEAQANHGSLLVQMGEYDAALPILQQAFKLDPTQELIRRQIGQIFEGQARRFGQASDWPTAILKLRAALELNPNEVSVLRMLQTAQTNAGRNKAAARTAEHLLQLQK